MGVINNEKSLGIYLWKCLQFYFTSQGIGANRREMLIIIMFFLIKGISTSMTAIFVSTAKVLKLAMSSQYWWLTARNTIDVEDTTSLFISCEFAVLNSCCIFILASDQLCVPLCLSICCQVSIISEFLFQNSLTLPVHFKVKLNR